MSGSLDVMTFGSLDRAKMADSLWDDWLLWTFPPWSTTYLENQSSGSGSLDLGAERLRASTGTTSGSEGYVRLRRMDDYLNLLDPTWDRERRIRTVVRFLDVTDVDAFSTTGRYGVNEHVGFEMENGTLYASVADGSTQNRSSIKSISAGTSPGSRRG